MLFDAVTHTSSGALFYEFISLHILCFTVKDDRRVSPSSSELYYGDDITFTCSSSRNTLWIKSNTDNPKTGNLVMYGTTKLSFHSVQLGDIGYYFCFGYNPTNEEYFLAMTKLEVYGKILRIFISIEECVLTLGCI